MVRKNGKKKFSKEEFVEEICMNKCFVCYGSDLEPTFCYNQLYRKNAKLFINSVMPNLINHWQELVRLQNNIKTADEQMLQLFRKIFCNSNICNRCASSDFDVYLCISKWMDQGEIVSNDGVKNNSITCTEKKIKPFLFIPKNIKFNKEIDRILENYSKQPDTGGGTITEY